MQEENRRNEQNLKTAAESFFAALSAEAGRTEYLQTVEKTVEILQELGFSDSPQQTRQPDSTLVESMKALCEAAHGICFSDADLLRDAKQAAANTAKDRRMFERVQKSCYGGQGAKSKYTHWNFYVHRAHYKMDTSIPGAPTFEPRIVANEMCARFELLKGLVGVLMDDDQEYEMFKMETSLDSEGDSEQEDAASISELTEDGGEESDESRDEDCY